MFCSAKFGSYLADLLTYRQKGVLLWPAFNSVMDNIVMD
jgi:hypothetical protein